MNKKLNLKVKLSARLTDHLIQAILIFASVFLAFWLTEHRDTKASKKVLDISLQYIASEMDYNHRRIEHSYGYYLNLITQIDSLRDTGDTTWLHMYGQALNNWNGVQTPRLRSTAYQTFLNKGINDQADFDMANSLAGIYNLQSIVENLDKTIFEEAATDNTFTALPKIRHQFGIYSEILPQLLMAYQHQGKKILEEYGYNAKVSSEPLIALFQKYQEQHIQ